MPRELRYHVPEAFYHVIARGNDRHAVFMQEDDYQFYLSRLEKYAQKFAVKLHAYALMDNHVHLLVQEWDQPLSRFMQGVQQSYTQYVNKKYERVGHLFQGRYKAFRIETDEYLLAALHYIHNNPVKAGLVGNPSDYRWSSQRHYSQDSLEGWVETKFLRAMMLKCGSTELVEYEPGMGCRSTQPVVETPSVGGIDAAASPVVSVRAPAPSLDDILQRVADFAQLPPEQILGRGSNRAVTAARRLFIASAARYGHTLASLCRFLGRSSSGVTETLQMIRQEMEQNDLWQEKLRSLWGKNEKNEA